jgi:hypothetical protein
MTKRKDESGFIRIGTSTEGKVVLVIPRPGDLLFTVEQARIMAKLILDRADEAEKILHGAAHA